MSEKHLPATTYIEEIATALQARSETLAVAESSTSGLIMSHLTDISGASNWFRGGVVAYTNALKQGLLDLPVELLHEYGAVSPECAAAMARGVQQRCQSHWGLAETGIAGSLIAHRSQKPDGLCYIAVITPTGMILSQEYQLATFADRIQSKNSFAEAALLLLAKTISSITE